MQVEQIIARLAGTAPNSGTFPRYRYDQLMNIGWKVMIPIGMAAVLVNAVLGMTRP
jgi:NADH:ubiquinone oxidoreductase subunit H